MTVTRMLSVLLLAGSAFCAVQGCDDTGQTIPNRTEASWQTVWSDEFDGAAGEAPDPTKWTYDIGRGDNGWGNAELQHYTKRPENVSQTGDGNLAITARQEATSGADYSSSRIKSQGLFEFTYGRVEARIKLPTGAGIWPAFWMLGADFDVVGWPATGEIDIMEYRGQTTDTTSGALHGPGYFGGSPLGGSYFLPDGLQFDDDFHVFAVEWDPGRIVWLVDETVFHVATTGLLPVDGRWVFDHDFFMILNLAVGGTFVGPPDASTPFPQQLLVDYVRVQKRMP
ncbi:MAG: beta-glucanase (GH16 family) [Myxococcota bacterium]|jgi:beta-glucanase (GH16 family)